MLALAVPVAVTGLVATPPIGRATVCSLRRHSPAAAASRSSPVALRSGGQEEERRLVPRSGDPRLFWLDEWFDTPSERAERERMKQENIDKWGKILSAADTFDDAAASDGSAKAQPAKMVLGLPSEWLLVGGSTPIILALLAKALGGW
eukprot:4832853-Prymnesium_polylepis.2